MSDEELINTKSHIQIEQQRRTQKMYTNYDGGWMLFQHYCLLVLSGLTDLLCIEASELAFFFTNTEELILLVTDGV